MQLRSLILVGFALDILTTVPRAQKILGPKAIDRRVH